MCAEVLVAASLILACSEAHPTEPDRAAAASMAAVEWLELVDASDYEGSWEAASEHFRQDMARFGKDVSFWVKALEVSRAPLGELRAREATRVDVDAELPGVANDAFVKIDYSSSFSVRNGVTETIGMILESDGEWRMATYVIDRE